MGVCADMGVCAHVWAVDGGDDGYGVWWEGLHGGGRGYSGNDGLVPVCIMRAWRAPDGCVRASCVCMYTYGL